MTDGDQEADADEGTADEAFPVEEAFSLIGNDLRAEILRVLGEQPHEGLSFSDLRDRVAMDVDSGQFNYHLQQLVGHFIEKTDDGYELPAAGLALYRAIRAGTFNERVTLKPFEVGLDCYFCDTPVEASVEDGSFVMECPGCDHVFVHTMLPPSAVEDDRQATLERVAAYNRRRMLQAARGVCPVCVSEMELEFLRGDEVWSEGAERHEVFVHRTCTHCGQQQYMAVGMTMLDRPVVVAFFHDHGRDLTAIPHWKLDWVMTDEWVTVHSEDPWEFELRISCDDEVLVLVVDDELAVVESRREPYGESDP